MFPLDCFSVQILSRVCDNAKYVLQVIKIGAWTLPALCILVCISVSSCYQKGNERTGAEVGQSLSGETPVSRRGKVITNTTVYPDVICLGGTVSISAKVADSEKVSMVISKIQYNGLNDPPSYEFVSSRSIQVGNGAIAVELVPSAIGTFEVSLTAENDGLATGYMVKSCN